MLMSLISLSDDHIESVTAAVREWCALTQCDIDSEGGRRAITISVDLIQTNPHEPLLDQLIKELGPFDTRPEIFSGTDTPIDKPGRTPQTSC